MLNEPGLTSPELLTATIKKGKVNFNRDKHMMKKLIEHKKEKMAFQFNGNGCIGLEVACNKELTEAKYIRTKVEKSKSIDVKPLA